MILPNDASRRNLDFMVRVVGLVTWILLGQLRYVTGIRQKAKLLWLGA